MREQEDPELPAARAAAKATASTEPATPFADLALTAPILSGKLARLPPEQLALIFPRMNSVGPL
ncbi:hypothetical protein [Paenarthrobacter nitroguajacolicus]|uniref:hypothetical protein n=1 Tax=Paenarthrobacter nitroguajacolicus TaxID=211146 RepID=UPI000A86D2B9|nr:hypothetical protein [Paenarthrobacter nitroguajacolicus]